MARTHAPAVYCIVALALVVSVANAGKDDDGNSYYSDSSAGVCLPALVLQGLPADDFACVWFAGAYFEGCHDGSVGLADGVCYKVETIDTGKGGATYAEAVAACGAGTVASIPDADVNSQAARMCATAECWPGSSIHPSSLAGLLAPYLRCGRSAKCWVGLTADTHHDDFEWEGSPAAITPLVPGVLTRALVCALFTDGRDVVFTAFANKVCSAEPVP